MKLRKCVALGLAGLMMLSLAACGSSGGEEANESQTEGSGGGTNLTVSWWGNQSRNEKTQGALDLYSEQNPGVTFEGQFSEWADYWNKLATSSASHSLPDIIQMDYKYLEQYVSNDLLVDLTPYVEDGTIDVSAVSEDILNSGKVGDGLYAIPTGINAPALIYNKTVTDEAGVTIKDNMSMPISVYTENNIIISCAKIYFDNEKVTNFEEYKIIIDFDQSTNEYVATIISHDYLSNKMTISTYYRKFGGYVYICAQSDFDIGAKQFDIFGYDTINNVGMTTEEYNNMSQTFKESCNHFFLTEIAKLNSVYFNIFENKSTNINYNQDEMLFIQTLNI